jgi:hypothetical protein
MASLDLTWIFGSSRSGSSWLLRMLRRHPDVVGVDETGLGHHLGLWRPIALAWQTPQPPPLTTFMAVKQDREDYFFNDRYADSWRPALAEFFKSRLGAQLDDYQPNWRDPATRVVIKEPGGSQMAPELLALEPSARLIFLLRDGRDVVDSWLDAYADGSWASQDGAYSVTPEDRLAFVRWQAAVWRYRTEVVAAAYQAHDPRRRAMVRYEELLAEPLVVVSGLLEMLGLANDPELVEGIVGAEALENVPDEQKGAGKEIRRAKPGGWREHFSDDELAAVNAEIGACLSQYGY